MIGSQLLKGHTARAVAPNDWQALISELGVKAVIFDCDGTLVLSAQAHLKAMQMAALNQGQSMSEEWYLARSGLDRQSLFAAFGRALGDGFDVALAARDSIAAYEEASRLVRPIAEVVDLVHQLDARDIPMAVVTNAERRVLELSLMQVDMLEAFATSVTISDGYAPKPAPEMYLAAMEDLGVSAHEALIFEDSPEGVQAALAAGAHVIQIISAIEAGA